MQPWPMAMAMHVHTYERRRYCHSATLAGHHAQTANGKRKRTHPVPMHAFDQNERFRGFTAASSGRSITTVNSILSLKSSGGCDGCPLHSNACTICATIRAMCVVPMAWQVRGRFSARPVPSWITGSQPTPSCPPSCRRTRTCTGRTPLATPTTSDPRRWSGGRCPDSATS